LPACAAPATAGSGENAAIAGPPSSDEHAATSTNAAVTKRVLGSSAEMPRKRSIIAKVSGHDNDRLLRKKMWDSHPREGRMGAQGLRRAYGARVKWSPWRRDERGSLKARAAARTSPAAHRR
jgi:hypothetical protein